MVVVISIYVLVALGSQMLVSDHLIVAQREIAFATVGQEALGTVGRWLATAAALLATSSAINATLFSTSRLVRDLSAAGEAPPSLAHTTRGIPATAVVMLAAGSAAFAMLPGINELLAFGSLTFLGVFGLVNHLNARTSDKLGDRVLGHLTSIACVAAVAVVLRQLAIDAPATLALTVACLVAVVALRLSYIKLRGRQAPTTSSPP